MAGALLTNVQAGERKGEDMDLGQKSVQRFTAQLGAHQAVADQFKITAELLDRPVVEGLTSGCQRRLGDQSLGRGLPPGLFELLVALLRELQALKHVAEFEPVRFEPVPGCPLLVDLGETQAIHLEGLEQGCAHLAPLHGNAELITQSLNSRDVPLEHQLPLVAGCPPGDSGSDRGVAVPVGTNPGSEGAESRWRQPNIWIAV